MNRLFCIFIFGILSCITPVDLEIERTSGQLVIFGSLGDNFLTPRVTIYRTAGFENRRNPIFSANVKLLDHEGNIGCFIPAENGVYLFDQTSMDLVPGRRYHINIELLSGEIYESIPQEMPENYAISESNGEFIQRTRVSQENVDVVENVVRVSTETEIIQVNQRPLYLRWELREIYKFTETNFPDPFGAPAPVCYLTNQIEPERIELFNGERFTGSSLEPKVIGDRIYDRSFYEKVFFLTTVKSMNRETYEYWEKVAEIVSSTGSLFDVPPATIPGNIFNSENTEEVVLGYFEVTNNRTTRFRTVIDTFDLMPDNPGCEYNRNRPLDDYPDPCLGCTILKGCCVPRPSFWGE